MTPTHSAFEVATAISGELRLLVVDATNNVKGFEHACTKRIFDALAQAGVQLAEQAPRLATSLNQFAAAFETEAEWNALLLFSHGRRETGGLADYLRLADVRANWYLANGIDMRVADKAVFLCVCEGACEDAVYVLAREQLALVLAAPTQKFTEPEAEAFFPAMFTELRGRSPVTPEDIRDAIVKHSSRANGKMKLYSAVGLI